MCSRVLRNIDIHRYPGSLKILVITGKRMSYTLSMFLFQVILFIREISKVQRCIFNNTKFWNDFAKRHVKGLMDGMYLCWNSSPIGINTGDFQRIIIRIIRSFLPK